VSWLAVFGASSYDIAISGDGVNYRVFQTAVRAVLGTGSAPFTDTTIIAGATPVKAAHLNELRFYLDTARAALGLTPHTYSDTLTGASTVIKAQHILDLRSGVQ
jgi:hypothetical protein